MDAPRKEVVFEIPPAFYLYADGSVERGELRPPPPPSPHDGVAFKDLTLNAQLGLWARLYLPSPSPPNKKLPLVLFFHGGGFILGSPAHSHSFCLDLVKRSGAIWFSASYRLAPEHRLPAAFDDGFSAFQWLHSQALLQAQGKEELMEDWLAASADFSKCFVAGTSAGGCIAHRVTLQALNKPWSADAWAPLRIRGLIPIHPGFARNARSTEEEKLPFDPLLNWQVADMCFKLGLPDGASRDDPLANPVPELASHAVRVPPKALVALAEHDVLHFVGEEYAQALKQAGCSVDVLMSHGVGHCFFALQPYSEQAEELYEKIVKFVSDQDCVVQNAVCGKLGRIREAFSH